VVLAEAHRSRHAARCCAWRLALAGLWMRRAAARLGAALWGGWAMLCLAVLAPVTWLLIRLAPDPARAWRRAGAAARLLLRLTAVPLHVRGVAHLPA
jgi:hypothetical protein